MDYIDDFLEYLSVVKKYSEQTIINYQIDLNDFQEFCKDKLEISKINKESVNKYMNHLYQKNLTKTSISRKLSSLRSFYNYLQKESIVEKNYFKQIKNPKKEKKLPKLIKENDIDVLFTIPNLKSPFGQRNLLIIRLLYSTGIRVSELVNIKIEDINYQERTIKILGKGSKERMVVYGYNTDEILNMYINDGRNKLNKNSSKYLLLNKDGNKITTRYIRKMLDDLIIKAGVNSHLSPHMLRHTFATNMLNNGADLVSVKDLLGHSSLNTTSIYTHLSNEKLSEIYHASHPRA